MSGGRFIGLVTSFLFPVFGCSISAPPGVADSAAWTDGSNNPVLAGDPSSPWMQAVGDPVVLRDGSVFKMWFAGHVFQGDPDEGITEIGYATSADGVNWSVRPEPVLHVGDPGEWDASSVETPAVIRKEDGTFEMWYSGFGAFAHDSTASPEDALFKIGHAVSPDGIEWTKDPANPVLDIAPEQPDVWDAWGVADPHVIKDGETYRMWYTGAGLRDERLILQIGYATSSDGTRWTRYADNPVLPVGPTGSWDGRMVAQPGVFADGDTLVMLYAGNDRAVGEEGEEDAAMTGDLGLALSADGIHWIRSAEPILRKGASGTWNALGVWGPTGVVDGGTYKMWYSGVVLGSENIRTGVGYATRQAP